MKDVRKNGPKNASKRKENSETLSKGDQKQEKRKQKPGQKISIETGFCKNVQQMYHFKNSYQFRSETTEKISSKDYVQVY